MKILANDGISQSGIDALQQGGFEVITTKVAQVQLEKFINEHQIDAILVRSATQVRQELIDACPSIKLIGRGGVGMDNIDVDYAKDQGLHVINTPAASSSSVAELVFAHLFGMVRFLHQSNREMPLEGDSRFKDLKKAYATGSELRGKKIGIIGFGRIGQEVAKIALGLGMEVIANDHFTESAPITVEFFNGQCITIPIETTDLDTLLKESDFISLHVPVQESYVIGKKEIEKMKTGVGIVNAARGGVIDEMALISAIETEKVKFAGLDVFEKEPAPEIQLLMKPELSLTPHIGAATIEAQDRIGTELATQIIALLKA
ncbi:D-2-hydroxyacid dehydrogenase [Flavobacteriaceae bacterium]|jgi:D-3-phosphoglycerate dehydrogenase|nr:D-2-hydroxyacid dehydrogenase [Flavobacterium sp.]MBT7425861.1 D-2-hydroxyacid dehydrogenase [Flavobacterium sp.]MDA8970142.1 D-2-hydroxyacid dehydrogenase [Flavobacteriaceae bacterium]MDC3299149.1 D-2-hydroxyacid dehydrogenase [Flavobacteriaceae bacterium]